MDGKRHLDGTFDSGSFRDPSSRVFHDEGRILRSLSPDGFRDWKALEDSPCFPAWLTERRVVQTEAVTHNGTTVLEHERIPFWSYPYEWSFSMLRDAALLHLDLLETALRHGLTMKDATPFNVQFVGTDPIFIDIGSFAEYEAGEPWLGYRQFCQQFLYPLLVRAHADVSFQPLLRGSLDGISANMTRQLLRGRRTLASGVLTDVVFPAKAEASTNRRERNVRKELSSAGFNADIILGNVRRLRKTITKTTWEPDESTWSAYADCSHVATQRGPKEDFVRTVAAHHRRSLVWDLGANDGHFSRIAADHADVVVAIDGDEETVDNTYRRLRLDGPSNVLPLVMNLADPSPGLGWRGAERRTLEQRGTPDLVLMLAVIHHLVIGSNLPLAEVIAWVAGFGAEIVLEWVPLDDPMAQQLAANKVRREIHADYDETSLRRLLDRWFTVVAETPIEGRRLFHLTPHS